MKTDRQHLLEIQRRKPIADIVRETLERHRGKKLLVALAGIDLGVSDATFYNWCDQLNIDIDEYKADRAPVQGEAK